MKSKILITTVTHGNESFSIPVVEKLSKKYYFVWRKNNLRAYKKDVRFTQQDLNRSGPGKLNSSVYEERLAKKIISFASKYDLTLDIHGSSANCGIFALVSEPSTQNIELAKKLCVKNIVLWPSLRPNKAPLSQFIPNCIEIECGPKNDPFVAKKLKGILERFLRGDYNQSPQNIYIVTDLIKGGKSTKVKDFVHCTYKGNKFIPLLANQYPGITCYCMQQFSETLAT